MRIKVANRAMNKVVIGRMFLSFSDLSEGSNASSLAGQGLLAENASLAGVQFFGRLAFGLGKILRLCRLDLQEDQRFTMEFVDDVI